jgi:hypothetical protein
MERQDKAAPFLLGEDQLPARDDVVQIVRAGRYKCTGARLLDNEKLALRLVELVICGWGVRRIAAELQVSADSVRAAKQALVARGELRPYKERVVAIFEEIIETGALKYRDGLEQDLVPLGQIPVGVGIFSDKRGLALGEPTSITVTGAAVLDVTTLSVERLNDWVAQLPAAVTPVVAAPVAIESPSTVNPSKP